MVYKPNVLRSIILIFLIIFFSCNRENEVNKRPINKYTKESLVEVNKMLVSKDAEQIKSYVERRNWNMEVTESGLWFMIYKQGEGTFIQKNDRIGFNYEVWLLNGTLCYSSEELGIKSIVVGSGGVESGLEEGVLMLKKGSKARFILPPHLAHGLIGDENRIPARASIVYNIEILNVEE
jgi:FKBP-type peptidyl-prolyl cis-trans isomerase